MQKNTLRYVENLVDLGMKEQEARVYLACLRLGQTVVSDIAKEADVQRTFVYDILDNLQRQGIVSALEIRGKKNYSAISVEQFSKIQSERLNKFETIIPELKSIEKTVGDRPRVRFYEGVEGIKTALYDPINILDGGEEITAYGNAEGFYQDYPEFVDEYVKARLKKKIISRTIAIDTLQTRAFVSKDQDQLRTTLLVPAEKFPFTNEINIYGNKVSIMSIQGEYLAVIIESESVAKTQRSIFELAWLGAQSLNPKKSVN